jgi:hypothetical protein
MNDIELQDGLEFYWSNEKEFSSRGYSIEKVAALCFEAGKQLGRYNQVLTESGRRNAGRE